MTGSQVSQNSGQPCNSSSGGPLPVRATWNPAPLALAVKCSIGATLFRSGPALRISPRRRPCLASHPRLELGPTEGQILPVMAPGEVAEWSNAPHSKCGIGASLSGVRIPPSPPGFPDVRKTQQTRACREPPDSDGGDPRWRPWRGPAGAQFATIDPVPAISNP